MIWKQNTITFYRSIFSDVDDIKELSNLVAGEFRETQDNIIDLRNRIAKLEKDSNEKKRKIEEIKDSLEVVTYYIILALACVGAVAITLEVIH